MYTHILLPFDFGLDRDVAGSLAAAKVLASPGARFTLLHAVEPIPAFAETYVGGAVAGPPCDGIEDRLRALAEGLPNAGVHVTAGKAGPAIVAWAQENGCDCIVIASHEPVFSDILQGSTAQQVLRHATCAVHVIR